MFLRKKLDNKQQTIETLLEQTTENVRLTHQLENNTFNNDVNKDVNIRSSKHQPSSKLADNGTIRKSTLTAEKISIKLNDIRKESRKRFYESK